MKNTIYIKKYEAKRIFYRSDRKTMVERFNSKEDAWRFLRNNESEDGHWDEVETIWVRLKVRKRDINTPTREEIREIMSKGSATDLAKCFVVCTGLKYNWLEAEDFFGRFARSRKQYKRIEKLLYEAHTKHGRCIYEYDQYYGRRWQCVEELKRNIREGLTNYTKVPVLGYTHLYFVSPYYGHSDYNKWCALPIKGNEKFCETLIKVAKKHFEY